MLSVLNNYFNKKGKTNNMEQTQEIISTILGCGSETLSFLQLCMRGLLVYLLGILFCYVNPRFISFRTRSNFILYIILGSILAYAIITPCSFFTILGMVFFLTTINWILMELSFHFKLIEKIIKGSPELLILDGQIKWNIMHRNNITEADLFAKLRSQNHIESLKYIQKAYLENDGSINIILNNEINKK